MVKVLPLFPWIASGLHWSLELLLTYIMGAPVDIARIEALELKPTGTWSAHLRAVRLSSTLPGDTFPVGHLDIVTLHGNRIQIDSVSLRGGELQLVRLGKHEKNFRYFPRRRARSPQRDFVLRAESIRIHLANYPPGVFLNLSVRTLYAHLHIDSLSVRITDGRTRLDANEVCISGSPQPFPERVLLAVDGSYGKKTDLWSDMTLILAAPEGMLHFCGDIARWEEPYGHLGGFIRPSVISEIVPAVSPWFSGERLYFIGEISRLMYEVRLSGRWRRGRYDLCMVGARDTIRQLGGTLHIDDTGALMFDGSPDRLRINGRLKLAGIPIRTDGLLNLSDTRGTVQLVDAYGGEITLSGNLRQLNLNGKIGTISFTGKWHDGGALSLAVDTVCVGEITHALRPYTPLLRGRGYFPVQIRAAHLIWPEYGTLSSAHLESRNGRFFLTGHAHMEKVSLSAALRLWGDTRLDSGGFALTSADGYLYGEWVGDSAGISATARWEDMILRVSAHAEVTRRRLWLTRAEGVFPGGERMQMQGCLTPDSADAQLQGVVPLPWLLRYLPLSGVTVSEGELRTGICGQGSWDTLLRWDNPTEGQVILHGVQGYFPGLALPLRDLYTHLSYSTEQTTLHIIRGQVGDLCFQAEGEVLGALSYLYTDWYRLQGRLRVEAEHLIVSDFWRRVERGQIRPQVRLPSQLDARVEISVRDIDILGLALESAHIATHIEGLTMQVDTLDIRYAHAQAGGRAYLDVQDSTCYMVVGRFNIAGLPVEQLIADLGVKRIPTFQRLGLRGHFNGQMQFNLRFTPEIAWLRQSSLHAEGSLSGGRFHTPGFMRWLRPYYLEAYRDSMDFYAQVTGLSITDGFLRLSKAFLLTRVAALEVSGYHYLPGDRFLYRLQAIRVRRRVQRYADLETLFGVFSHLIDRSFGLIYVEKENGRVYWRYPWRYALRRFLRPGQFR